MRIPYSTYRIPFTPTFGFEQAREIIAYLRDLGISDLNASPIFKAKSGSTHGYDVIDPNPINPELGGAEGFEALTAEVKKNNLGWLQDFVPNHTAFDGENQMLMDVFENGPSSAYFDFFDIEWNHPLGSSKGKVLAPFLGRFYAECLENGEIQLKYDQAGLSFNYYSLRFPLRLESYEKVFDDNLAKLYAKFTSLQTPYEILVLEKKRLIIGKHLAGDVDRLAQLLRDITSKDRYGSDITLYGLKRALVEVLAYFPVYRTYVSPQVYHEADRELIRQVLQRAKDLNPGLYHELTFIEHALLLEPKDHLSGEQKKQRLHFIMRLQQLTGPLMAKGFEDTTLYVYNRRLSLNNVGGSPKRFGVALSEFHAFSKKRAEQWLHTMNATSTHDAKRGEDVRARINVLSEMPGEWALSIRLWSKLNEDKRKRLNGKEAPDRNDEYFLYQTLIGAFQENEYAAFVERVKNYIVKAVREAKVHTAWLKPDTDYEDAFLAFIEAIL